jgi:hypothetical protein
MIRNATFPTCFAGMASITPPGKNVPNKDKAVLLTHMDEKKKMWLDAEAFARHKVTIAPEFSHLLGDALGPKQRSSGST